MAGSDSSNLSGLPQRFLTLKTNDSGMSTASVLVEINPKVKDRLDHLKLYPEESYSDVIDRIAGIALDQEPLDPETKRGSKRL